MPHGHVASGDHPASVQEAVQVTPDRLVGGVGLPHRVIPGQIAA